MSESIINLDAISRPAGRKPFLGDVDVFPSTDSSTLHTHETRVLSPYPLIILSHEKSNSYHIQFPYTYGNSPHCSDLEFWKKVCETQRLRTLGNTEVIFGIQPPWWARGPHTVLGSRWCRPLPMLSPDPYTLTWVNWVNSQKISIFDKIVTEFWKKFLNLQRITILIPKQDESPFSLYFTPSARFP